MARGTSKAQSELTVNGVPLRRITPRISSPAGRDDGFGRPLPAAYDIPDTIRGYIGSEETWPAKLDKQRIDASADFNKVKDYTVPPKEYNAAKQLLKLGEKLEKKLYLEEPERTNEKAAGDTFSQQSIKDLNTVSNHLASLAVGKSPDSALTNNIEAARETLTQIRNLSRAYAKTPSDSRDVRDPGGDPVQSETSRNFDDAIMVLKYRLNREINTAIKEWSKGK